MKGVKTGVERGDGIQIKISEGEGVEVFKKESDTAKKNVLQKVIAN